MNKFEVKKKPEVELNYLEILDNAKGAKNEREIYIDVATKAVNNIKDSLISATVIKVIHYFCIHFSEYEKFEDEFEDEKKKIDFINNELEESKADNIKLLHEIMKLEQQLRIAENLNVSRERDLFEFNKKFDEIFFDYEELEIRTSRYEKLIVEQKTQIDEKSVENTTLLDKEKVFQYEIDELVNEGRNYHNHISELENTLLEKDDEITTLESIKAETELELHPMKKQMSNESVKKLPIKEEITDLEPARVEVTDIDVIEQKTTKSPANKPNVSTILQPHTLNISESNEKSKKINNKKSNLSTILNSPELSKEQLVSNVLSNISNMEIEESTNIPEIDFDEFIKEKFDWFKSTLKIRASPEQTTELESQMVDELEGSAQIVNLKEAINIIEQDTFEQMSVSFIDEQADLLLNKFVFEMPDQEILYVNSINYMNYFNIESKISLFLIENNSVVQKWVLLFLYKYADKSTFELFQLKQPLVELSKDQITLTLFNNYLKLEKEFNKTCLNEFNEFETSNIKKEDLETFLTQKQVEITLQKEEYSFDDFKNELLRQFKCDKVLQPGEVILESENVFKVVKKFPIVYEKKYDEINFLMSKWQSAIGLKEYEMCYLVQLILQYELYILIFE